MRLSSIVRRGQKEPGMDSRVQRRLSEATTRQGPQFTRPVTKSVTPAPEPVTPDTEPATPDTDGMLTQEEATQRTQEGIEQYADRGHV